MRSQPSVPRLRAATDQHKRSHSGKTSIPTNAMPIAPSSKLALRCNAHLVPIRARIASTQVTIPTQAITLMREPWLLGLSTGWKVPVPLVAMLPLLSSLRIKM